MTTALTCTDAAWFQAGLIRLQELCGELAWKPTLLESECYSVVSLTLVLSGYVAQQVIAGNMAVAEQWMEFLARDEE